MGSNSFEDYLRDEDPDFYTLLSSKESFGSSLPSNCSTSEPAGLQSLNGNQPTNTGPVSGEVELGRVPGVAQYQAAPNPNFPYFSQLQPNNQQAMSTMPYVIPTQMYQQGHLPKITSAADHFGHEGTRIAKELARNFQVISPHMMNAMPAQMMGNTMALQNPMQAIPQLSQHQLQQRNQYQMQMASLQNSAMVQQAQQAPPVQQNVQQPPNPHQQQLQSQPSQQPPQQQAVAPPPQLQNPLLQQQHQQNTPQQSRSIPDLSTSGSVQIHPIEAPADRTKNWVNQINPTEPIQQEQMQPQPTQQQLQQTSVQQQQSAKQQQAPPPQQPNARQFDPNEPMEENKFAHSFQVKDVLISTNIHQENANAEIQNETTHFDQNSLGDIHGNENNFEYLIEKDDLIVLQPQDGNCYENEAMLFQNGNDFNQNVSFSAAENADFHPNETNAGYLIQGNHATVQQAPLITMNQQSKIPQHGNCYENGAMLFQNGNDFNQNKSFSAAENTDIHRNETNAGYFIQGNHATVQQAPLITVNQQSQIKDALNCFLEEGYNVRSKEQRMHAAMVLHNNGRVKKIDNRIDSVYEPSKKRHFRCDLCPTGKVRWFTNMLTLRRHIFQHLDHKPLACLPTCGERFYRDDKLRLHIQKHHPEIKLPPTRRQKQQMKI